MTNFAIVLASLLAVSIALNWFQRKKHDEILVVKDKGWRRADDVVTELRKAEINHEQWSRESAEEWKSHSAEMSDMTYKLRTEETRSRSLQNTVARRDVVIEGALGLLLDLGIVMGASGVKTGDEFADNLGSNYITAALGYGIWKATEDKHPEFEIIGEPRESKFGRLPLGSRVTRADGVIWERVKANAAKQTWARMDIGRGVIRETTKGMYGHGYFTMGPPEPEEIPEPESEPEA